MQLSQLKVGESARVIDVNCLPKTKKRLAEIGLLEGVIITLVRKAPMRCPLQVRLRNFNLAIRISLAEKITVEKLKKAEMVKTQNKTKADSLYKKGVI